MKRLSVTLFSLGLLWMVVLTRAQEINLPVITDTNVAEVTFYADLGSVDKVLEQPNTPNLLLEDWVTNSTGHSGLQTAVWNSVTRTVEATIDTKLGLVSPDGSIMMVPEETGFSLWDLRAYKRIYRYEDPIFFKKMATLYRQYDQTYSFFYVTDTKAYVGGFWRLHVIDLATGQEVARTLQWCQMPAEIADVVQACADGTGEFSMLTPAAVMPETLKGTERREYPMSHLAIEARYENRQTNIYLLSLRDGTERDVWHQEGYWGMGTMWLTPDGRMLLMRDGRGHVLVSVIFPCRVQARRDVNLRKAPGQTAELLGTYGSLHKDDVFLGAVAQSKQPDGIWWQLVTGEWLRSDFAEGHGTCESLPSDKPRE